jgi:hypothetical protein
MDLHKTKILLDKKNDYQIEEVSHRMGEKSFSATHLTRD